MPFFVQQLLFDEKSRSYYSEFKHFKSLEDAKNVAQMRAAEHQKLFHFGQIEGKKYTYFGWFCKDNLYTEYDPPKVAYAE